MNKTKGIRISTRSLLLAVGVTCVILALARIFLWPLLLPLTPGYWENVSDTYALWQTEEMLSLYLARNAGKVPAHWHDLSEEFKITNQSYSVPNLSYLEDRVVVDFVKLSNAVSGNSQAVPSPKEPILRLRTMAEREIPKMTDAETEVNQRLYNALASSP